MLETWGQKAYTLWQLHEAGFRVPPFFVIEPGGATPSSVPLPYPLAVRSSGTLEDLGSASFAGQYESILNVNSFPAFEQAVAKVQAAATSPRIQSYLQQKGLNEKSPQVSVIVQQMIDPVFAGVGFTLDPVSGDETCTLVEYSPGLGDAILSGLQKPARAVLDLASGSLLSHEDGEKTGSLPQQAWQQIAELFLQLQAFFGHPQDVEWAFDKQGTLWVLQSRPVTKVQWLADPEEWTNADLKDGGVSARVCTPLMHSLYRDCLQHSMQKFARDLRLLPAEGLEETWTLFRYGRLYWNAGASKRALRKIPGFCERHFDEGLGIQKHYGEAGPCKTPVNPWTILRALPIVLAWKTSIRRQKAILASFASEFYPQERHWLQRITEFAQTSAEDFQRDLGEVLTSFHFKTETTYFAAIYHSSNIQNEFKDKLADPTSYLQLAKNLGDVRHLDVQKGIQDLCTLAQKHSVESTVWEAALQKFLRDYYYHGESTLDLCSPRWSEEPEQIRSMVRKMLAGGLSPSTSAEVCREPLEKARGLALARFFLRERENMRDLSTRCYYIVRQYVLEAGRRMHAMGLLTDPKDVFMLESSEIAKNRVDHALLRYRKFMHQGYRKFQAPNEFGGSIQVSSSAARGDSSVLQGIGCSAGVVEGRVRVIFSLAEIDHIQKGDILVTRFTDPGWTPVLALVAGVITEVGGLLSHAAVIGRELGIPAILNLSGVCQVLQNDQRITMNGSTGVVTLHT